MRSIFLSLHTCLSRNRPRVERAVGHGAKGSKVGWEGTGLGHKSTKGPRWRDREGRGRGATGREWEDTDSEWRAMMNHEEAQRTAINTAGHPPNRLWSRAATPRPPEANV